jgi:hypothetical protein
MVTVEMGNEDGAERLHALMGGANLMLCGLTAVNQHLEPINVDHLRATLAVALGSGGSRPEYGDEEIHSYLLK